MAIFDSIALATVMDVTFTPDVWNEATEAWEEGTPFSSDSLRISNITMEGPTKTAKAGLHAKTIMKYGKTMRLEMEDVIFTQDALKALFGAKDLTIGSASALALTDKFPRALKVEGKTFGVGPDGTKQWITITIHKFLPDALLNLTMEAEGDFAVMAIGGEIQAKCGEFFTMGDAGTDPCEPME